MLPIETLNILEFKQFAMISRKESRQQGISIRASGGTFFAASLSELELEPLITPYTL